MSPIDDDEYQARLKAFADATGVTMAEVAEGWQCTLGVIGQAAGSFASSMERLRTDPGTPAEALPALKAGISRLTAPRPPALVVTLRRRRCSACQRRVRITLYSPSTAVLCGYRGAGDGQCCIRCTRELRSP